MPLRILFSATPAQIAALPSADAVAAQLEAALNETRPAARSRAPLSERIRALIDAPEFATMATLAPDGRPRQSVVWTKTDGADVLVSTTTDRLKYHDLLRDPRISLLASPKDHPYIYTATPPSRAPRPVQHDRMRPRTDPGAEPTLQRRPLHLLHLRRPRHRPNRRPHHPDQGRLLQPAIS